MRILRQGPLSTTVELGDLTVTSLLDGVATLPADWLSGPDRRPLPDPDPGPTAANRPRDKLRLPVRAFLVQGPAGCLLIDAGAGQAWQAGLGQLGAALLEAGIWADAVTAVALTHTHVDHISGLVDRDGGLAFPNAMRIFVAVEEITAFRAIARMAPLGPRLMPLEQGDGPLPGVTAINAPGHSPGHMAYLVEGRLLIWGDLVHHAAVQFARPDVGWILDHDHARASATRLALMEQAVEAGWLVAGAHLPDPGIGRIERDGSGYAFRPL